MYEKQIVAVTAFNTCAGTYLFQSGDKNKVQFDERTEIID